MRKIFTIHNTIILPRTVIKSIWNKSVLAKLLLKSFSCWSPFPKEVHWLFVYSKSTVPLFILFGDLPFSFTGDWVSNASVLLYSYGTVVYEQQSLDHDATFWLFTEYRCCICVLYVQMLYMWAVCPEKYAKLSK